MSRDIPFFEMFTELRLSGELRLKLAGAVLKGARIDRGAMTMALELLVKLPLAEEELEEIRQAVRDIQEINERCGFSREIGDRTRRILELSEGLAD